MTITQFQLELSFFLIGITFVAAICLTYYISWERGFSQGRKLTSSQTSESMDRLRRLYTARLYKSYSDAAAKHQEFLSTLNDLRNSILEGYEKKPPSEICNPKEAAKHTVNDYGMLIKNKP